MYSTTCWQSMASARRSRRDTTNCLPPSETPSRPVEEEDLLLRYLSDKVVLPLLTERNPEKVLEVAQLKLKYLKSKKYKQGKLEL